jgi:hypothetical protein
MINTMRCEEDCGCSQLTSLERAIGKLRGFGVTLQIELTPEVEDTLRTEAARRGLPVEEYALEALVTGMSAGGGHQPAEKLPQTGAEALAYWKREGVPGLFADRPDTPEFARELRHQAETRAQQARRDAPQPHDA